MNKLILTFLIFILNICVVFSQIIISTVVNDQYVPITIEVEEGNAWGQIVDGIVEYPQMAIWVEDIKGNFVETLFVTQKFANPTPNIYNKDIVAFRGALPLWIGRQYTKSKSYPTISDPLPDSITSATPSGRFILNTKVPPNLKKCYIYMEIDTRGDYNTDYPNTYHGQPSVVYRAEVNLSKTASEYEFTMVGTSFRYSEGVYVRSTRGITSARNIVRNAKVIVR